MACDTRRETTGELEADGGASGAAAGAAAGGRGDGGTEFKSGAMTVGRPLESPSEFETKDT